MNPSVRHFRKEIKKKSRLWAKSIYRGRRKAVWDIWEGMQSPSFSPGWLVFLFVWRYYAFRMARFSKHMQLRDSVFCQG